MKDINEFQEYLNNALNNVELTRIDHPIQYEDYDIHRDVQLLIVKARNASGLTQKQLAQLSGISQGNISRFENGKICPSIDVLKRLADALGKRLIITLGDMEESI